MKKNILFPFDINDDNRQAYTQAIKMAEEKKAKIILFTTLPKKEFHYQKDNVYFHLLELNGYFQTQTYLWNNKPKVEMERKILCGERVSILEKIIRETQPTWIIQPEQSSFQKYIQQLVIDNKNLKPVFA